MARSVVPFALGSPAEFYPALQLQRMFDDVLRGIAPTAGAGAKLAMTPPRLDVSETDKELRIRAELPGVAEEDFSVELDGDLLTLRGEKRVEEEEKDERHHVVERAFGSFVRTIQLPFAPKPDQVRAAFENGVLTITIPKSAGQEGSHRIPVGHKAADGKRGGTAADRAAAGNKPGQSGGAAQSGGSAQSGEQQEQQAAGAQPSAAAEQPRT
jgi:HSP20 family protein